MDDAVEKKRIMHTRRKKVHAFFSLKKRVQEKPIPASELAILFVFFKKKLPVLMLVRIGVVLLLASCHYVLPLFNLLGGI